jgi:signal transduction histidine kinase/CheY-like chemotaxis protein
MLEQTQIRDEELNRQRNRLSDLVSKRTAELKISEEQKQQLMFQQTIQEAYGKIVGLLNSIDISEILEKSLNEIVPQSGSQWGAFYFARENSSKLKLTKSVKATTAPDDCKATPFFLESADQLANRVFNSQVEASEPLQYPEGINKGQLVSLTAFPLGFQNKPLGVLVLAAEHSFSGWNLSFLKNTSRQLGVALHNALTFQELRHQSFELEQSNIELSKASQLKSEFLANMSHELRTPLNHIIGFTDLVVGKKFGDINETQEEYLNDVLISSHHLLELINDILDIAKVEAGKVELDWSPVKVSHLLNNSLTMIREKAGKNGCQLVCEEKDIPEIFYADERKFKQVLFNLLTNAVKFTPNGGEIRLSSQIVDRQWPEKHISEIFKKEVIENLDCDCDRFLHISVNDDGIGIKEESFKSIFEVFQQEDKSTTTKFGGTGLGLSLCKQFIELHKGGIWVESSPGEGSCFNFLLPIYETDPSQMILGTHSRSLQKDTPLVLVVDDDEKICSLISYLLQEAGCEVQTSMNGQSAIEKAKALKPDMVFLDVMLPKRSGWEVLNSLKSDEMTADIPVVICSAIEDRQQAISLGAADSIVKPVTKDDLLRCLKNAGMQTGMQNQNLAN